MRIDQDRGTVRVRDVPLQARTGSDTVGPVIELQFVIHVLLNRDELHQWLAVLGLTAGKAQTEPPTLFNGSADAVYGRETPVKSL
jgi:hypothetical protein